VAQIWLDWAITRALWPFVGLNSYSYAGAQMFLDCATTRMLLLIAVTLNNSGPNIVGLDSHMSLTSADIVTKFY
jgi:hypothetical protein